MPNIDYGQATQAALADYFIERFNLVGRDAEYGKSRFTLSAMPRDSSKLAMSNFFDETLRISNGFSGSPDWQEGNKNYNPSKTVKWRVGDPYAQYGRLSFDVLALKRNNLATLIDIKGSEADGVRDEMLNTLEFSLWSDGSGNRGQIESHTGTTTFVAQLARVSDVYNFPFGAVVYGNTAADGSGADHTNRYEVTDLDPVNGKVTLTQIVDNTSPLADNDYLFVVGSKAAYMPGIPTFIPSVAPNDTLYGVPRTGNPALSGWRFPFQSSIAYSIQAAFSTMGRWINRVADKFVACLSTGDWLALSQEREGLVFENPGSVQKWGVDGLVVRTAFGPINCVAVPQMADGGCYILDFSSWCLYTLGNLPHVVDEDGLTFVRGGIGAPDGYSQGDLLAMQFRMWTAMLCLKPMSNAYVATK